ncbi:MAG: hypothetical protein AAF532_03710 [Planctomycetota bacterium]
MADPLKTDPLIAAGHGEVANGPAPEPAAEKGDAAKAARPPGFGDSVEMFPFDRSYGRGVVVRRNERGEVLVAWPDAFNGPGIEWHEPRRLAVVEAGPEGAGR